MAETAMIILKDGFKATPSWRKLTNKGYLCGLLHTAIDCFYLTAENVYRMQNAIFAAKCVTCSYANLHIMGRETGERERGKGSSKKCPKNVQQFDKMYLIKSILAKTWFMKSMLVEKFKTL